MTRWRRPILITASCVIIAATWFGYRILFTLSHIHEAYAAWDTGTLLVEYMKSHNDQWPTSWPDLLTVLDSETGRQIPLRGAQAGDMAYAKSLRDMVAIDWRFDPSHPGLSQPVTRPDGKAFPVRWEDPNDMVREYLGHAPATQKSEAGINSAR